MKPQQPAQQQSTRECAHIIKALFLHENNFYKVLEKAVMPTYINEQGVQEYGTWERLKKYLGKEEKDDLSESIFCLKMLFNIHQLCQFTPHTALGYLMIGLEKKNPALYRRFWVEYFYLSAHDSNSPNTLFHSSLPYFSILILYITSDKHKKALERMQHKFERGALFGPQLTDKSEDFRSFGLMMNEVFLRPIQMVMKYKIIFDDILKNIPDGDPLKPKMQEVVRQTHVCVKKVNDASVKYGTNLFIKAVPKLMQKYQFTFRQASAWASKDMQRFLMVLTNVRIILPADVICLIATYIAPITAVDVRTIFSKVRMPFCIGVAVRALNKYHESSTAPQALDKSSNNATLMSISGVISFGMSLFNNQATVNLPLHYERAAKLLTELAGVKDYPTLEKIIKSHADALKSIAVKPVADRFEKILEYLVERVNEVKGIALSQSNSAVCVKG